jgi:GGDEF domain-containing protein
VLGAAGKVQLQPALRASQEARNALHIQDERSRLLKSGRHDPDFYSAMWAGIRRLFAGRFSHAPARAKREQSRMALRFIDLDKFKPIDDEYGHEAGDFVLQEVARRIESCLRSPDSAARLGGDEFLVLFQETPASICLCRAATRHQRGRPRSFSSNFSLQPA